MKWRDLSQARSEGTTVALEEKPVKKDRFKWLKSELS